MDDTEIRVQFARLTRHFDFAMLNTDIVSILDLAHTLRIWTDTPMKKRVDQFLGLQGELPKFENPVIRRNFYKKLAAGTFYCYIHLIPAVTSAGALTAFFWHMDRAANEAEINALYKATTTPGQKNSDPPSEIRRMTLSDWLGTEVAVFGNMPGSSMRTLGLSREIIIKRVANALGASHAISSNPELEDNRYDPCVKYLHGIVPVAVAGINPYPLTYIACLGFASGIINALTPLLRSPDSKSSP